MKSKQQSIYQSFSSVKGSKMFTKLVGINGVLPLAYAERLIHIDHGVELLEKSIKNLVPQENSMLLQKLLYDPTVYSHYQLIKVSNSHNTLGKMRLGSCILGHQAYGKVNANVDD